MTRVLAIETSCDETAAAVVENGHLVLSDPVATQIDIHKKYGGVVPELASRNHVVDIVPVVNDALEQADLTWADIDAIGVTQGPGLVGALLVGVQFAKALAWPITRRLFQYTISLDTCTRSIYIDPVKSDPLTFLSTHRFGSQWWAHSSVSRDWSGEVVDAFSR